MKIEKVTGKKVIYIYFNGLIIGTVICEPCYEERAENMNKKELTEYDNSDNVTMPILFNKRELEDSSDDDRYDDFMPRFLSRSDLDDLSENESDEKSDKCDNAKKNEELSDKILDYAEDFN